MSSLSSVALISSSRASSEHRQSAFELTTCVPVSGVLRYFNPPAVQLLRIAGTPHFLKRLATMEVTSRVIGIVLQKSLKLVGGSGQIARVHILHGEAVAPEGVAGV